MKPEDNEIEAELQRLRQQVSGTAVTAENLIQLRRQVEELMSRSPAPRLASLGAEILHGIEIAAAPPASRAPRCELLRRELERVGGHTASQISGAIGASGFRNDEPLSLQEARELTTILWPLLRRIRDKFENEAVPRDRVRRARGELRELREALPADLSKLRDRLGEIVEDLGQRLTSRTAEEQLDKLLARLRSLAAKQRDWQRLDAEKVRLEENPWAQDHPDDSRVVEMHRLLAQLDDLRRAETQLADLPERIAPHLERGEYLAVFDHLRRSHDEAERLSLRHREPLEQATRHLVERLEQLYGTIVETDHRGDTEAQRRSLEELESVRSWLCDLPQPLRVLAADLEARVDSLVARLAEGWQEAVLEEVRERVSTLPESKLKAYLDTLDPASPPAVHEWAQQIKRLLAEVETARRVELELDEEQLRRLERAAVEYGYGPTTEEAARLAQDYREALGTLEEIEVAVQHTPVAVDELLRRLEPIVRRFPRWRRVTRVQARVRDAEILHELLEKAKSGSRRDLQAARRLAAKISDASFRERMEGALTALEEATGKWERIERALDNLQHEKRLDRLAATITAALQDADSFVRMAEKGTPAAEEQFPQRWHELEALIKRFLLEELPGRIQTWVESAVAAADTRRVLGQWRERFDEWLAVLQDPILREEGEELFDRREAELDLEALVTAHRFDAALTLLKEKRRLFDRSKHRELTARLERSRAVLAFRRGEDPQLASSLEVASQHGLDSELAAIFVEHFRKTGTGHLLAELVRLRVDGLADHPQAAQFADWCLRLQREDLDSLVDELTACEDLTALRNFFEALSLGQQPHQSLYLLFQLKRRAMRWDPETRDVMKASLDDLRERVSGELDDHAAALERWSAALKGAEPMLAADLTDQELRDLLERTHKETLSLIDRAFREIEQWLEPLMKAQGWLEPTGIPHLGALLDESRQFVHRLRTNRDLLEEIWGVRGDLLCGRGEHRDLRHLLTRLTLSALGRVQDVFKLVGHYFRDYEAITRIVEELIAVYRAEGEGMTPEELRRKDKNLRRTYGYDFSPEQDRFQLLHQLDGSSYSGFFERLRQMVGEVEAVTVYEQTCKQAMRQLGDQLELRLKRLDDAARSSEEQRSDRVATAKLVARPVAGERSLAELIETAPEPSMSQPAKERLKKLQGSSWYQILGRSVALVSG